MRGSRDASLKPAGPVAGYGDDSFVVGARAVDLDVEPRLGEVVGEASSPLDQGDAVAALEHGGQAG